MLSRSSEAEPDSDAAVKNCENTQEAHHDRGRLVRIVFNLNIFP